MVVYIFFISQKGISNMGVENIEQYILTLSANHDSVPKQLLNLLKVLKLTYIFLNSIKVGRK